MKNDTTKQRRLAFPAVLLTAALLAAALLAGGCDLFVQQPEQGSDAGTDDGLGNGILKISVAGGNSGASRAMAGDIAKNAVNYYEVIFWDANTKAYTRLAWHKGETARLAVPPADYNGGTGDGTQQDDVFGPGGRHYRPGEGTAVLLAGTNNASTQGSNYTLLAAGPLTKFSDNPNATSATATTGTTITVSTKWVQFTLYAFEAAPASVAGLSAFKITGPDTEYSNYMTGWSTGSYVDGEAVPTVQVENAGKVPFYLLPKNANAPSASRPLVNAEYTIKVLGDVVGTVMSGKAINSIGTDDHALGELLVFNSGSEYTAANGPPPGTLTTAGFFTNEGDIGLDLAQAQTSGNPMKITNKHRDLLGKAKTGIMSAPEGVPIKMQLPTPDRQGLSLLYIDAHVSGLSAEYNHIVWHIRGGLLNYQLDSITASNSYRTDTAHGGILLATGGAPLGNTIHVNTAPPVVTSVTVSPAGPLIGAQALAQGATQQFIATVAGTGFFDSSVVWSFDGATNPTPGGSVISQTGLLTVNSSEPVGTMLKIKATSVGLDDSAIPAPKVSNLVTIEVKAP
jgi:hypothetical protein